MPTRTFENSYSQRGQSSFGSRDRWLVAQQVAARPRACPTIRTLTPPAPVPLVFYAVDRAGDELWSFVRRKTNKPWVWFALEADTRQIVAFRAGPRSEAGARGPWNALPGG